MKTEKSRVVRVFVSSTFRDMHAEREELIKRVFPQLRKICEQRGVTWGEVDLRWGITDEQKAEGKVLPICLEEIKRCRPYFIGLLGERYGWLPEEIPDELIDREPWLAEHREKSVTELEIIHGVLNNPAMPNRACFYFRDPAYVDQVPAEQRADFVEPDQIARQKLANLKDRIRASGLAVRENYPDPQALGQLVLEDLTTAINQEFPPETVPEPLDREAAEHEAFARSRAGVYIGRREYFDRLDSHAAGDGLPLVILGESGAGKSALVANWALNYRKSHSDELLIMHFIGASGYSADWATMVRRIMGEFKRRFDIQQDIPDKPDELRLAFANWLHMAAAKGKVILILDALNQLEDREQAPDLVWLAPVIPPNVRLIVSTLPGRPLDELKKRNWPTLQVNPLDTDERRKLIEEYLGQYRKALHTNQIKRILASEQTANALYLRALLEELRLFGRYEKLDERIDCYLTAQTIPQLYEKILERYEQDYERDRPGLVRDAMSLIWASRRGLSEAELLELLGKNGEPLPRAYWSPLYLPAEQSLVNRSGLIGFSHEYLREGVLQMYLPTEKRQQGAHLWLADYFTSSDIGPRKVDELPWQLAQARAWEPLQSLLTDRAFLAEAWGRNKFEVKTYWTQIEARSLLRMVDAYRQVIDTPRQYAIYLDIWYTWSISELLLDMGHLSESFRLIGFLTEHFLKAGDKDGLQKCLAGRAVVFYFWGQMEEAMSLAKKQEQLCRELGNKYDLPKSLRIQAAILRAWDRLEEAMVIAKQAEQLCRELGNKDGLAANIGIQALILYSWHRFEEAMALHKYEEQIYRELGDKGGLSISLGNQANILKAWGQDEEAMTLYKQEEQICYELGDKNGLSRSISNQASFFLDLGRFEEAMTLAKQAEQLCREHGYKDILRYNLHNQANILYAWGQLEEAMKYYKQAESLCKEVGNKTALSNSLCGQANILYAWGQLEEAMQLHKQEEQLCRELGNKDGLARSLINQASLLAEKMARPEEGLALAEEAYRLATEHHLDALVKKIKPILESVRAKAS